MIINLINTILIACGMAVNTTNFNSVEKPPRKNEIQNLQINENLNYGSPTQSIKYQNDPDLYIRKYKLTLGTTPTETSYLNVYDTIYAMQKIEGRNEDFIGIYKIKNYFNSRITFTMALGMTMNAPGYYRVGYWKDITGIDIDNYYNMTLTVNTPTQLENLQEAVSERENKNEFTGTTSDTIINVTTERIVLNPKEEIQLYFYYSYYINAGYTGTCAPTRFNYQGEIIAIDNHTEIIDVPGLMFTVLTLPFSFISQAFNLTIFPDTPYQVNFTNLFLTVIAIFILLWLIKHIFK